MFAKMSKDIRTLVRTMNDAGIDVDEYQSCPTPQSVYTLKPAFECPIVVDYILAVFPTTSTGVQINLGPNRQINVSNIAAGVFEVDVRMQLEFEDVRQMVLTPAGVGHFEIMGHCAQRVQDRP